MASILASGTTEAASTTFTLTTDSATVLISASADAHARAVVQIQGSDSAWSNAGELTKQYPAKTITGAGTYRVLRAAASTAFGIDKN